MLASADELRRAPLLAQLTAAELARVCARATIVRLRAGEWLFRQDDPATRFYFVRDGQMRLFRLSADGEEKIVEIIGPAQTFAEATLFMGTGYPVCAAALEPCVLIGLDAADFAAMLRDSPSTCFALLASLSQRLHALIAEIDRLTLHSASERVASWLLEQLPPGAYALTLQVPKATLAARLSIKPETWSRIARRLSARGLIRVTGNRIDILDVAALRALAAGSD